MTDSELMLYWYIGLAIGTIVVLIAAALLIAIILIANSIAKNATAALGLVEQTRDNTKIIWALQDTNEVAGQLLGGAKSILRHAGEVATALKNSEKNWNS